MGVMSNQVKLSGCCAEPVHAGSGTLEGSAVHQFPCCRATREALGGFEAKAETQELRIEVLAGRVEDLERRLTERDAPLLLRIVRGFWRFLFGRGKTRCAEAASRTARLPVSEELCQSTQ